MTNNDKSQNISNKKKCVKIQLEILQHLERLENENLITFPNELQKIKNDLPVEECINRIYLYLLHIFNTTMAEHAIYMANLKEEQSSSNTEKTEKVSLWFDMCYRQTKEIDSYKLLRLFYEFISCHENVDNSYVYKNKVDNIDHKNQMYLVYRLTGCLQQYNDESIKEIQLEKALKSSDILEILMWYIIKPYTKEHKKFYQEVMVPVFLEKIKDGKCIKDGNEFIDIIFSARFGNKDKEFVHKYHDQLGMFVDNINNRYLRSIIPIELNEHLMNTHISQNRIELLSGFKACHSKISETLKEEFSVDCILWMIKGSDKRFFLDLIGNDNVQRYIEWFESCLSKDILIINQMNILWDTIKNIEKQERKGTKKLTETIKDKFSDTIELIKKDNDCMYWKLLLYTSELIGSENISEWDVKDLNDIFKEYEIYFMKNINNTNSGKKFNLIRNLPTTILKILIRNPSYTEKFKIPDEICNEMILKYMKQGIGESIKYLLECILCALCGSKKDHEFIQTYMDEIYDMVYNTNINFTKAVIECISKHIKKKHDLDFTGTDKTIISIFFSNVGILPIEDKKVNKDKQSEDLFDKKVKYIIETAKEEKRMEEKRMKRMKRKEEERMKRKEEERMKRTRKE
ncbi:hypothetical protein M896_051300 [Ordospora colligata OC4]|uniref:Uncharacterized protein n=1 Tax=Ordospora colligata OC4 TaxID=1354746 RepID=A0A0B2UF90_9MICR|nr:uncharacterized protein M896_051300 [Ordospora colligata OC4]KHN69721.1 hypothetical protein M896_051300 [Ordospora colligata OC4]